MDVKLLPFPVSYQVSVPSSPMRTQLIIVNVCTCSVVIVQGYICRIVNYRNEVEMLLANLKCHKQFLAHNRLGKVGNGVFSTVVKLHILFYSCD